MYNGLSLYGCACRPGGHQSFVTPVALVTIWLPLAVSLCPHRGSSCITIDEDCHV
jgi:hypothetical protein